MYGLPKTHKEGNPLCSILSVTGSSHHERGKWLAGLLQPVLEWFLSHCISDLFTYAKTIKILTSSPMSSCVLLMCPACSPLFPLMKPSKSVQKLSCKPIRSFKTETSFSAIGQHLLQNPTCAHEYNDNKFSILACGRTSFHPSTLEATYIKTSKPNLCKQKEFVYDLKITH